jgi:cytochrome c oxidase assembly factor CtaG
VKERAIYHRERAAGLSPASYLCSKLAVLGLISGLQAALLVVIGLIIRPLPPSGTILKSFPLGELIIAIAILALGVLFALLSWWRLVRQGPGRRLG